MWLKFPLELLSYSVCKAYCTSMHLPDTISKFRYAKITISLVHTPSNQIFVSARPTIPPLRKRYGLGSICVPAVGTTATEAGSSIMKFGLDFFLELAWAHLAHAQDKQGTGGEGAVEGSLGAVGGWRCRNPMGTLLALFVVIKLDLRSRPKQPVWQSVPDLSIGILCIVYEDRCINWRLYTHIL